MANVECDILSEDTFPLVGSACTVMLAQVNGANPVLEFFGTLDDQQTPQVGALLKRASDNWPIKNPEICKPVEGPIRELKKRQVRLLYFEKQDRVVLVHGLIKQQRYLRTQDIKRAVEVMQQFEATFDWRTMNYKEAR